MATIPGAIPVTGFIGPTDSTDVFAVTDSIYGVDGLRNVADHAERDAITAERRRQGMFVGTQNDSKYWSLNAGPWNFDASDWTLALDLSAGPLAEIWETIGSDIQTSTSLFSPAVPNVLPAFDDQQDLGSKTKRWKDLYLGSVIDFETVLDIRRDTDIVSYFDNTGLVLPDGKLIKAENGGSTLDMRTFGDNSFALTTDAGAYGEGWLYASTTTAQFGFSTAMQAVFNTAQVVATTNYNYTGNHVYHDLQPTGYRIAVSSNTRIGEFLLGNTEVGSFISSDFDQFSSTLSSRKATMNAGVYNSSIVGGNNVVGNKDNFLFVGNFEIQGTSNFDGAGGIGLYTVDPTLHASWGPRAIPDKAYVDAQIGANNALDEVLGNGNTTKGQTMLWTDALDSWTPGDSTAAINGSPGYPGNAFVTKEYVDDSITAAITGAKAVATFTPGTVGVANTVTHSLGTVDIIVQIWDVTTGAVIRGDINNATTTQVDITFTGQNPAGDVKVVIM